MTTGDQYDGRVGARPVAPIHRRPVLRRHVIGIEDVFHAERNPVHCPPAAFRNPVEVAGASEHGVGIEVHPGTHSGLIDVDPLEAGPRY